MAHFDLINTDFALILNRQEWENVEIPDFLTAEKAIEIYREIVDL